MTTHYKIGIDLGGTKIESVILDSADQEVYRNRIPTQGKKNYNELLTFVYEFILTTTTYVPDGKAYSIGIGIPGAIDPECRTIQNANTTCLIGHAFQADLEKLLNRPIGMENDANCFTLAECVSGAVKDYPFVFGIIMGTGCGGGICIGRCVREGKHRIAGEWGHFSVDPNGMKCYCGNRGCVETKISGSGVEASFYKQYGKHLSMKEIVEGYRQRDYKCIDIFNQFIDDFGRCLGGLISILDPDAVVIGGGLSNIDELYQSGVDRVRQYAFHNHITTPVLKNSLGDSAGVLGAAWIGK